MKTQLVSVFLLTLLTPGCSTTPTELLPPAQKAQVSFHGMTQAGDEEHQLQVQRLSYYDVHYRQRVGSDDQYLVYVAGSYGPEILEKINGAGVLLKKTSNNIVEIYYVAGAHTHMRERWKLIGYTAELLNKEEIEWYQSPKE